MIGASMIENASVLACTQPGRSTTSTGAVRSAAARPVNSRTSPVERSAAARSSATAAAASSAVTTGPCPATRLPRATARSQSTIESMSVTLRVDRQPAPARSAGAAAGAERRRPGCRGPARRRRCCASVIRSAASTNAIGVPAWSVATPASARTPVRVPVLARTRPTPGPGRLVEAGGERAGEAADRQAGQQRRAGRRWSGSAATRSTSSRVAAGSRFSRESPLPSRSTAPAERDAEAAPGSP